MLELMVTGLEKMQFFIWADFVIHKPFGVVVIGHGIMLSMKDDDRDLELVGMFIEVINGFENWLPHVYT